jgi:hypothetical protein
MNPVTTSMDKLNPGLQRTDGMYSQILVACFQSSPVRVEVLVIIALNCLSTIAFIHSGCSGGTSLAQGHTRVMDDHPITPHSLV